MRRAANVSPRLSPNLNLLDRGAVGCAEQRYEDHPVGDLVKFVFLAIAAASTKRSFAAAQQIRHLSVIVVTNSVRPDGQVLWRSDGFGKVTTKLASKHLCPEMRPHQCRGP
jgi:hypothetical protein